MQGLDPVFASPASTSLDELVQLRRLADFRQGKRRRSPTLQAGESPSRRLGRGLDFAEVRAYQPGDDVRLIDWKVTARTGQAHTKLFVEERETPVLLVIDFRAGMRFGTRGMYKSVLAARLAAVLGWMAVAQRDRVGGFSFTDNWHREVRPRSGRRGLLNLFQAIVQAQKTVPTAESGQLADSLSRLAEVAQAGSQVILLSDFRGFDESARAAIGRLRNTLSLSAVQIVDPLEREAPPPGRYAVVSAQRGQVTRRVLRTGGRRQAEAYAERHAEHCRTVGQFFSHGRHRHCVISTDRPLRESVDRVLGKTDLSHRGKASLTARRLAG